MGLLESHAIPGVISVGLSIVQKRQKKRRKEIVRANYRNHDMLSMANFGAGVDHFLSSFEKFLSKLSKLKNFSFDKRVSQSSYCAIDKLLVQLPILEYALSERGERQLSAVAWSGLQFDGKDRMSFAHGEEGPGVRIVRHKSHVFGSAAVVVGIADGGRDAEPSIRSVFDEWRSGVSVPRRVIDHFLVRARDSNRGGR